MTAGEADTTKKNLEKKMNGKHEKEERRIACTKREVTKSVHLLLSIPDEDIKCPERWYIL